MIYYKVKKEFDRKYIPFKNQISSYPNNLIGESLLTEKQMQAMAVRNQYVEKIKAHKSQTYYFGGVRFLSDSEVQTI